MGRFASIGVRRAVKQIRNHHLQKSITANDFLFAAKLLSDNNSTTLVMGEFMFLQLLRLKRTTPKELESLKALFNEIDATVSSENPGILFFNDLKKFGYITEESEPTKMNAVQKMMNESSVGSPRSNVKESTPHIVRDKPGWTREGAVLSDKDPNASML